MSAIRAALLTLLFLLTPLLAMGQGAPAQIDAALLDLSARLGYSLALDDLAQWRWQQSTFADSALGCTDVDGSGGALLGYSFLLTYGGAVYDYRVSADETIVILCSQGDPLAEEDNTPLTLYSNRLCPPTAAGGPYMRSRVNVGMDTLPLGYSINMRGQAAPTGQVLRALPAGTPVRITDGPDCAGGFVWWLALAGGQTGYIAEAGNNTYFIEPQPPNPLPSRDRLNPQLAPFVREFARLRGNFLPRHSWSSDGINLTTTGAKGSDSLWIYDMRQAVLRPRILVVEGQMAALAARPGAAQALFGDEDGTLSLWNYSEAQAAPAELLYLNAHGGAVSALAFSPDGRRIASAGPRAFTSFAVDTDFAAIIWDLPTVSQQTVLSGHDGLIRALSFSPDGSWVASGADDGTLRVWDAANGAQRASATLGAPVVALDYSPDGRIVAAATARTSDNLLILNASTGAVITSYKLPTPGVTSIDFSPDGQLLAVGAAQGVFTIWDSKRHHLLYTGATDAGVYDISFSPDTTLLAVSIDKYALLLYGVPRGSG